MVNASQQTSTFLMTLIRQFDRNQCSLLYDRLATAEREERCLHRAVVVMFILLMLSAAGFLYCTLLLPEAYDGPPYLVIQCLLVLVLGSFISNGVFLGCLLWHRTAVTRLHRDCCRLVLELLQAKAKAMESPAPEPYEWASRTSGSA